MIIDGQQIQHEIKNQLKTAHNNRATTLRLDVVYVGNNAVIEKYIDLKKEFGEEVGVQVVVHTFSQDTVHEKVEDTLTRLANSPSVDGIIVQLPIPPKFEKEALLNMIPPSKDVDVLSEAAYETFEAGESPILPPVVGSIAEILTRFNISLREKRVAIVGHGRLVGKPVAAWMRLRGVEPEIYEKGDDLDPLQAADIVISGAGSPHIITPKHIKEGVVLIDAGTSSTEGGTKGDIDPQCAELAEYAALVPGGIGPITVAKLFENLTEFAE